VDLEVDLGKLRGLESNLPAVGGKQRWWRVHKSRLGGEAGVDGEKGGDANLPPGQGGGGQVKAPMRSRGKMEGEQYVEGQGGSESGRCTTSLRRGTAYRTSREGGHGIEEKEEAWLSGGTREDRRVKGWEPR